MNIRFICAVLLAFCSVVLFSCQNTNSQSLNSSSDRLPNESVIEESRTEASTEPDIPFVLREADCEPFSTEDRFSERYNMKPCVITSNAELSQSIIKPVVQYTDQFFEEHILLFFTNIFGDKRTERPIIKTVTHNQNTLFMKAERMKHEIILPAEEWWCGFLEISKTDIQGLDLSSVNIEINVEDVPYRETNE